MFQSGERDYPLDFFLEPMKPAKPPKTASGKLKLQQCLESDDYIIEEKIDGCHYFSIGGRIFSPRISEVDGIPVEKTLQVPHISKFLKDLPSKLILDGEMYLPEKKCNDVVSIMGSDPSVAIQKQRDDKPLRYMVFDVLRDVDGNWLLDLPWQQRREYLEALMARSLTANPYIDLITVVGANKSTYLEVLLANGFEGGVLKNITGKYILGKRPAWNWIKCKVETADDVVIMGFDPPKKLYTGKNAQGWPYWEKAEGNPDMKIPVTRFHHLGWVGAIVFGKYSADGELKKLGTCSGMTDCERRDMSTNPERYIGRVAKVKLMEFTKGDAYRHCSFVGLHPDKNPHECKIKE